MSENTSNNENTSNVSLPDFEKIIESKIENKFNKVMGLLPNADGISVSKKIHEYTLSDIYNGIIQTIIDIINETSEIFSERKYMSSKAYREKLISVFFRRQRRYFVGIILIILSFIIYFIDGSSV